MERTTVAIVGGGLAGLYASRLLRSAGIDFKLIEARERLGGRILSMDETGSISEDGFDLGPSWFWPETQPQLAALVQELGLATFAQHNEGDILVERMSRETPWRYRATHQEPQSMRLVGGTGALVAALSKDLSDDCVHLNSRVKRMALDGESVILTVCKPDRTEYSIAAKQVIATLPPRLLANVTYVPAIDPNDMQRWRETPTWMASHAKFIAVYDRPFWRDIGLSGTAQSMVGPLVEIHDATTASGNAALLAFVGVPADQREAIGETALVQAYVEQLGRLFGPDALSPCATIHKDWATDTLTATGTDRSSSGHPKYSAELWVNDPWQNRLSLGSSETSETEAGYLAGAVRAADRAVSDTAKRLGVIRRQ